MAKEKGLSVYANGEKIAAAPNLTKVTGTLDGIALIPYVQRAPVGADKSTHLKVQAVRASHTNTSDTTSGLIQNSTPYAQVMRASNDGRHGRRQAKASG